VQPRQNPPLNDENRCLDLGLVAWPPRAGRQHGGSAIRRHLGIGAIDLRLVQASLDEATLALSGTMRRGTPPRAAKARVWAPIQPASPWVQVASAQVKFEAPMTATKICAWRTSPVSWSTITGTVSPA
jgi:hypothetical protein